MKDMEVRYFQCPPTRGSFVKPKTLAAGLSLKEALLTRYEAHGPGGGCPSQHETAGENKGGKSDPKLKP
jgi:hypothetical protein